jgi:hypothetical protein
MAKRMALRFPGRLCHDACRRRRKIAMILSLPIIMGALLSARCLGGASRLLGSMNVYQLSRRYSRTQRTVHVSGTGSPSVVIGLSRTWLRAHCHHTILAGVHTV